jgi:hypothetical protein
MSIDPADITPDRIAGYLDGYEAALETVKSLRVRITTAPGSETCSLNDSIALGIAQARQVLEGQLKTLRESVT